MGPVRFVYWQEEGFWLGYLDEFPDYLTQGESFEELKSHLRDLHADRRPHPRRAPGRSARRRLKRRDLVAKIEALGCILLRHGANTIGSETRVRRSRSLFPDIPRSASIWPDTY